MKTIIFTLIFHIVVLNVISIAQFDNPVIRLTNGNNDWNPSFTSNNSSYNNDGYNFVFMAFERVTGAYSQIIVTKIGPNGPLDTGYHITNNNFINKNPSIATDASNYYSSDGKRAIIVWETNKNGNWDLYASIYYYLTGWSQPVRVDTSATDEKNVSVKYFDSTYAAIVYQSSNDIKLKTYNFITNTFSAEENLTSTDPQNCGRPFVQDVTVIPQRKIIVSYEREITANQIAVNYKLGNVNSGVISWIRSDTIAYSGNNKNTNFILSGYNTAMCYYETNRTGKWNIYYTNVNFNTGALTTTPVITENYFDNYSYAGVNLPLGDNSTHSYYGFIRKSTNKLQAVIKGGYTDSLTVSSSTNTAFNSKITKFSLPFGVGCIKGWMVFNIDSTVLSAPSRIYGTYAIGCAMGVNPNNTIEIFSLKQNYPNPFNPSTTIEYSILKAADVNLNIFDITGRCVLNLVNKYQSSGNYKIDFSAKENNLPSGLYFYKLEAGEFKDVKKMIILK